MFKQKAKLASQIERLYRILKSNMNFKICSIMTRSYAVKLHAFPLLTINNFKNNDRRELANQIDAWWNC